MAYGPYTTERARDNRVERVRGGQVYPFNSFSPNAREAIAEFRDARVRQAV